ncbi:HmuY family protein [Flavobacterium sp. TSSA_36]|uniref:HmuY family protein n=1 Tax=Flavobacterium sp. TSSA_36 TaxID=3447669 RepID=UPI003F3125CC
MKKQFLLLSISLLSLASCSSDDTALAPVPEVPSLGAIIQPAVGGHHQPNQVYVDLSANKAEAINRSSWDFGFYSGTSFRVVLNGSIKMAVKKLETNDITLPQTMDAAVAVGGGTVLASNGFVDHPTGVLEGAGAGLGTAIAEISATDADNKVYLVNLGFAIATTAPALGSVSLDGEARGWKKIRILRSGNGYKIQYADLNATTFTEKIIAKDDTFNFTFFSVKEGKTVTVEPQKTKWDLNFTSFTNYLPIPTGDVTYGYSDFIVSNRLGGTQAYQVLVADGGAYADFTRAKVVEANFTPSKTDQRIIGASWRSGGGPTTLPSVRTDRFYVVKDAAANYYKVRFLAMSNEAGVRGNPTFEYKKLE